MFGHRGKDARPLLLAWWCTCLWVITLGQKTAAQLTDVRALSAEPDFRQVSLHWLYPRRAPDLFAFRVDYCELQAWGINRCRTKMVDAPPRPPVPSRPHALGTIDEDLSEYGVEVTGLRMATNYTFSVSPMEGRLHQLPSLPGSPRNRHARTILVPTKGFSARATLCLPDVSEVEVHTGPHFSGRIAVEAGEGTTGGSAPWRRSHLGEPPGGPGVPGVIGAGTRPVDEPCAVGGDPSSPRDSYTLRIDHRRCGSHVNRSTVATFILVQENLPILTHSTRRFLVLCTFQPDALIVRAGISLPTVHNERERDRDREELGEPAHGNQLGGGRAAEVMAFQLPDGEHDEDAAVAVALSRQQRHHISHGPSLARTQESPRSLPADEEAQVVLTSVLLVSGVVGCAITAWWFAPRRRGSSSRSTSALADDSASTVSSYQNYENSLRDYSDTCSSLGSLGSGSGDSNCGTINSSILGSMGSYWRFPGSGPSSKPALREDDFGEVGAPGHHEPTSLVFAIRLPDGAPGVARNQGGDDTSSVSSITIREPTSLAQSDA